jgi:peptide/nickel transport system substrate-binding protein
VTGGADGQSEPAWSKRVMTAILVTVLVCMALGGMVSLATSTARAAAPYRTLTLGIANMNVVTYNPLQITLVDEYIVVYNVYSTLLTYDANYRIHGDLAYNWTVSSDGLTWTFHLVRNAYFTDPQNPSDRSHPVTSDDVLFSYQLNQQNDASILNIYTTSITAMSAPDPYTFTITTAEPYAAIYSTAVAVTILPKYVWSSISSPVRFANRIPIGSGATYYDYNNATFGQNIILRRSPNYYGALYYCNVVRPDQIYFKDYTDSTSMLSDFNSGASGLDAVMGIDPPGYLNLNAKGPGNAVQKWAVDSGFVGEISINVMPPNVRSLEQFVNGYNNPLLLNDTVRTAIAMSIDKSALVKYALLGLGSVADTLVPAVNPWHYSIPAADRYQFNPQAARALLNSQGWKYDAAGNLNPAATPLYQAGGQNPLAFRFFTLSTNPEWQAGALNITAWLAQSGIQTLNEQKKPGYSLLSNSQMNGHWLTGDYDIWLWDWVFTPVSDPSLDVMGVETTMSIGPTSDNFYSNSTFDSIYNQSLSAIDPVARRALTDQLQKMVYDYHSYILPYYRQDLFAATNGRPPNHSSGWTDYGNWSASPGLLPDDSDLPNLWFQVSPMDNRPPSIKSFPSLDYYSTIPTALSVYAPDPENDIQNYFWNFGDGQVANTTTPSTNHIYAQPGTYQATVRVSDSEWPVCGSTTVTISAYTPGTNVPPQVNSFGAILSNGSYQLANLTARFNLTASDWNNDSLRATWNFGDGSTQTGSASPPTNVPRGLDATHIYTIAGTYTVTATITDNQTGGGLSHTLTRSLNLTVRYLSSTGSQGPPPPPSANLWINYGIPVVLVLIVVAAVAFVILRRRRAAKAVEQEQHERPREPPNPPVPP